MTTGERLGMIMAERGISKKELIRRTGLSARTITRLMSGDRSGALWSWCLVAEAAGCTLTELVGV